MADFFLIVVAPLVYLFFGRSYITRIAELAEMDMSQPGFELGCWIATVIWPYFLMLRIARIFAEL